MVERGWATTTESCASGQWRETSQVETAARDVKVNDCVRLCEGIEPSMIGSQSSLYAKSVVSGMTIGRDLCRVLFRF
jgi:hypothetical protein